jgi:tetratricopeptide (TPR) repeat protein
MFARAATLVLLAVLATGPIGAAQPVAAAPPVTSAPASTISPPSADATPPPTVPHIAEGPDYDHCLAMLYNDPLGAKSFADTWASSGGGDGAMHCQALAQIELGNAATGADMLERLADAAKAPDLTRAAVYGQAVQAWQMAGQPARAFDAATLAMALSPNDPDLMIDRALAEGAMQRYREAIDDLDHALAIDPRRAEAFVLRASAWRRLNNLEVATADIEHALAINPDSAEALLERGILRQRTGNQAGAREDWQRAISLDPDSTAADLAQQDLALLDAGPDQ